MFTHCCEETPGQINPTLCHNRAPLSPTPVPFKGHLVSFGLSPKQIFPRLSLRIHHTEGGLSP